MNGMKEPIVLSSDDDLDWSSDEDDDRGRNLSKRILPDTMRRNGVHVQQPSFPTSSKRAYPHDAHRSRAESGPSTSYGAGTRSLILHDASGNGSSSRAKSDYQMSYRNNLSHVRDADYGQHENKRALPSSFGSSGLRTKQNSYRENLVSDRGLYMDNNHSRILPHTLARSKVGSSVNNISTVDPYPNLGFGEDRVMGDERVIYQTALQNINQPINELDVPEGILKVPLLRHQKIALAWMVEMESRTLHCLGGILADDQGLGKTISTIALILKQWPAQMKSKSKNNNHNAEALTLDDDDDDDNNGINTDDLNVGKSKTEGVSINEHKTLIVNVDDDDEDDDDFFKELENLDDDDCDGNSAAEVGKNVKNDNLKSNPGPSSSRQTINRQRPSAGTLIVCPATVLRQWFRELKEKVTRKAELKVLSYHGGNRIKDPAKLAEYDVVLTTYSIVANEVPKQPIVDEEDAEQKAGERYGLSSDFSISKKRKKPSTTNKKGKKGKKVDDSSLYSQAGALARVNWFRVVLDEAQTIKNHRTQTARACYGLRAKRRWCLSGTPIQNSIDELYSYFRFLRHHYYSSYKNFHTGIKSQISRDPTMGYKKLQAVLMTLLLRRTKDTKLGGQPIITLPPKIIKMKTVEFSTEERAFYSHLEAETRSQFKAYAAAGTVNQNYANILLMILRLRQACDHPLLVKGFDSDSRKTNLEKAKELPKGLLMGLLNHLESASALCLLCNDPAEDAVVTRCGHVFCYQCVGDYLNGDDNLCPASRCKGQISEDALFSKATLTSCLSGDDGSSSNENSSSNSSAILSSEYSSSKIKAALEILFSNCEKNSQSMEHNEMRDPNTKNSMSAQVRTEKLEDTSSQGPIKTIVFSQWTRMLDLFEYSLKLYCIEYRRLDGSMSLASRDRSVREFNEDPGVTVMLMSLKAGNLGLNMVAACHVILLDLWWNPTTEDQAIDRAHRIGQTRPVTVSRITIKDTVEDRILNLQEEKRKMVASAFGDDYVGSNVRLTIDDLKYIFLGSRGF